MASLFSRGRNCVSDLGQNRIVSLKSLRATLEYCPKVLWQTKVKPVEMTDVHSNESFYSAVLFPDLNLVLRTEGTMLQVRIRHATSHLKVVTDTRKIHPTPGHWAMWKRET